MVPLWVFLIVTIPLALTVGALLFVHFVHNPLPFPDWGNAGFVLPDKKARQAVIHVLRRFRLSPDFRVDTPDVSRAIYRSKFPFILDVTSSEAAVRVGRARSFIAITVEDPHASATLAAQGFDRKEYSSEVIHNPDPGLLPGKLSVVISDAMPGMMLVFRQHILKMGPTPPAWKDEPE